jgi:hypothetical protein
MSDQAVVSLITAVVSLIGTMFTGILTYLMARLNARAAVAAKAVEQVSERAAVAATAVEQVKKDLSTSQDVVNEKLDKAQETADKTHTLVNSNMGAQLKMHASLCRRMAEKTHEPDDIAAANQAERLLAEHEGKQAAVDRRGEAERSLTS